MKKKPSKRKSQKRKTHRGPVLAIRHSGAGVLMKTKAGLELSLCSSAAEVRAAGGSSKLALQLFPRGKKSPLCSLVFFRPRPSPVEQFFGISPWAVRCDDAGCRATSTPRKECTCVVFSTKDPATDPPRREEGSPSVEEGRWYKCFCDCTFFG